MAYIGKAPNTAIVNQTTSQSFNGTGSATAFTLNRSVNVSEDLEVFVNNVQQEPGSGKAYTASGTTLTFSAAPASGTGNIYVIYRGEATINPRLEHDANAALSATTGTFSGAFTSPGIDDNADATAITIDSSEIVMTGKTAADFNTAGFQTASNGQTVVTRDSATPFFVNRKTDDGDIIDIRKDNTTVGTIGTNGDRLYFTTANKGFYVDESGSEIVPSNGSGSNTNNVMNLGNSASAFKDLYLGGNLYIGGTGSANGLSDYEEGTFTPSFTGGITGSSYGDQNGTYVKIGQLVFFAIELDVTNGQASTNGNQIKIDNIPFVSAAASPMVHSQGGAWVTFNNNFYNVDTGPYLQIPTNTNQIRLYRGSGNALVGTDTGVNAQNDFHIAGCYRTA